MGGLVCAISISIIIIVIIIIDTISINKTHLPFFSYFLDLVIARPGVYFLSNLKLDEDEESGDNNDNDKISDKINGKDEEKDGNVVPMMSPRPAEVRSSISLFRG